MVGCTMIDVIKKTLLAGVGAAVVTKEKIEAALEPLVQQGKVSATEAKATAEKLAADGRREFESMSAEVNEKLKDFFARQDRTTQDRIAALEARVAALEVANAVRAATPPPTV
jgi:polyhydroxyalkanoate synthesis regulator phasin